MCECQKYAAGPVLVFGGSMGFGLVDITFDETLNSTDQHPILTTTNCRPFYGTGTISSTTATNTMPFFASGWSCGGPVGTQFTDNAIYYVMPGGKGKWASARGSGNIAFGKDFANFSGQAIFDLNGVVQLNP